MNQPLASPSLWNPNLDASQTQSSPKPSGAFEIKFLIDLSLAEKLIPLAASRMQLDPHSDPKTGGYAVEGIYFESPELDVFRKSTGYSRKKYRIRRYSGGPVVFLERKSKRRGIVTKRRVELESSELKGILERGNGSLFGGFDEQNEQAAPQENHPRKELAWFAKRMARLRLEPTLCLAYERVAFMQMEKSGPIRLTIDRNLGCCKMAQANFPSKSEYRSLLEGKCVLELKYRESMPVPFRELIGEFQLISQSVSKFRNAIITAGLAAMDDPFSADQSTQEKGDS